MLAPVASAHGRRDMFLDKPAYLPGDEVIVHGVFLDSDLAAPAQPIEVSLGAEGPVIAQATAAVDGTWSVTFTLTTSTVLGTYSLDAYVLDESAQSVTMIASVALVVGALVPPPQPPASAPSAATALPQARGRSADGWRQVRVEADAQVASVPRVRSVPVHAAAPVRVRSRELSVVQVRPQVSPPASSPTARPRILGDSVAKHVATPQASVEPIRVEPSAQPKSRSGVRQSWWMLCGLLVALATGAAAFAIFRNRSARGLRDPVEAELQAIVADELAKRERAFGDEPPIPALVGEESQSH